MIMNQEFLHTEIQWLNYIIKERYYEWASQKTNHDFDIYATLTAATGNSPYERLIQRHQLDCLDRVILALSFANEHSLDVFSHLAPYIIENLRHELPFGCKCSYNINRPFDPTYETAIFLMAGTDPKKVQQYSHAIMTLQQNCIIAQLINYDR